MNTMDSSPKAKLTLDTKIYFSRRDATRVFPHEYGLMVISIQLSYLNIKRVLVDPVSSFDVLY